MLTTCNVCFYSGDPSIKATCFEEGHMLACDYCTTIFQGSRFHCPACRKPSAEFLDFQFGFCGGAMFIERDSENYMEGDIDRNLDVNRQSDRGEVPSLHVWFYDEDSGWVMDTIGGNENPEYWDDVERGMVTIVEREPRGEQNNEQRQGQEQEQGEVRGAVRDDQGDEQNH
ncbi:hypothetical protein BJY04DRAFT_218351 [Aspergillus karnatakaensis]|uniref:uncharacterized protein n=1 Tax=Aspergillus karnatakaensis TaxID=1810916 RepID=UPI003CCD52B4